MTVSPPWRPPPATCPSRLHMYVREPLALVKSFFLDR